MKVVLINGPPRSGKDTLAQALGQMLAEGNLRVLITPLASALKGATHGLFAGLAGETNSPRWNAFEAEKEQPSEFFLGMTPRQAYIDVHEKVLKPIFGKPFLGQRKAQRLAECRASFDVAIIPDLGDGHQLKPFRSNFTSVVIRLSRPDCPWSDNRLPVESTPGHTFLDYHNDKTVDDMKHWLRVHVLPAVLVQA